MAKRVNKSYILIDGAKFKNLLETKAGKSLKEISLENGFSDSFLRMAVKTCKASPAAQAVARVYGIEPSEYEKPERVTTLRALEYEREQMSFDDLNKISREELKELVKESLTEVLSTLKVKGMTVQHDNLRQRYFVTLVINKEEIEEA